MASRTVRIGPKTVGALKPGDTLWDTDVRRFGARRRKGTITYFCKARIDGRQRWITIGRHGPLTPHKAREAARKALGAIDAGGDPTREREARRGMPTLAGFAQRWLEDHVRPKRKPSTYLEYKRLVAGTIAPALGRLSVDRIDRADILALHAKFADRRYAGNRVIAVVSAILTHAERLGLRKQATNPCRGVERYRERKRKRPLTVTEISRLWKHLDRVTRKEGVYVVAALRLLLLTGARKSEILSLRWDAVDLRVGVLRLADAKTGPRVVILSDRAIDILDELPRVAGNPYVIVGEREGRHLVNLAKPWGRIRTALGFPEVRVHDLRHTVGSLLAREAPLPVVRDTLGHKLLQQTSEYSHAAADDVRLAVDRLALAIAGPR